jgi:hypothetical protein
MNSLDSEVPLIIVPLGALWSVPWPAVGVSGEAFLGETHVISVVPSLTMAEHALNSTRRTPPRQIATWRSPLIKNHEITAFTDDSRVQLGRLEDAAAAVGAIVRSSCDLVVVAGHGRPIPEMGHFLELDADTLFTPADVLAANPPSQVALISCWGAVVPGAPTGDPMTIATILLARGCRSVLASTAEVADDVIATRFVNHILFQLPQATMGEAVRYATRRLLRTSHLRDGDLSRWAPIVTLGSP